MPGVTREASRRDARIYAASAALRRGRPSPPPPPARATLDQVAHAEGVAGLLKIGIVARGQNRDREEP